MSNKWSDFWKFFGSIAWSSAQKCKPPFLANRGPVWPDAAGKQKCRKPFRFRTCRHFVFGTPWGNWTHNQPLGAILLRDNSATKKWRNPLFYWGFRKFFHRWFLLIICHFLQSFIAKCLQAVPILCMLLVRFSLMVHDCIINPLAYHRLPILYIKNRKNQGGYKAVR